MEAASFISSSEFDTLGSETKRRKLVEESPALHWKQLPLKVIYKIENIKKVVVKSKPAMILSLANKEGDTYKVWATSRLCKEIASCTEDANLYIRSLGQKECETIDNGWYYDYDLVCL